MSNEDTKLDINLAEIGSSNPDETQIKGNHGKHYVDNNKLYKALVNWDIAKKTDPNAQMPRYVAFAVMAISRNMSRRFNFFNYTPIWKDEMIGDAIECCLKAVQKYDVTKTAPYSYLSKIAMNAYKGRIKKEKSEYGKRYRLIAAQAHDFLEESGNVEEKSGMSTDFYLDILEKAESYSTKRKPEAAKYLAHERRMEEQARGGKQSAITTPTPERDPGVRLDRWQ